MKKIYNEWLINEEDSGWEVYLWCLTAGLFTGCGYFIPRLL